ncbi:MAG: hypothetical protein IJ770_01245 [Alphaproteobacteria bacterium]|nr:hypothetical protein [Alphaproteobacteria bacterium]
MLKFLRTVLAVCLLWHTQANAQYINSSGDNPAIREYEREMHEMYPNSPEMWNRGIMYIFYDGQNCPKCAEIIDILYNIYNVRYEGDYGIFEVDYTEDTGVDFRQIYNLTQPISVVLVRVQNGEAWGYVKIDNLYEFADNPQQLEEIFIKQANNFTVPQNII